MKKKENGIASIISAYIVLYVTLFTATSAVCLALKIFGVI